MSIAELSRKNKSSAMSVSDAIDAVFKDGIEKLKKEVESSKDTFTLPFAVGLRVGTHPNLSLKTRQDLKNVVKCICSGEYVIPGDLAQFTEENGLEVLLVNGEILAFVERVYFEDFKKSRSRKWYHVPILYELTLYLQFSYYKLTTYRGELTSYFKRINADTKFVDSLYTLRLETMRRIETVEFEL